MFQLQLLFCSIVTNGKITDKLSKKSKITDKLSKKSKITDKLSKKSKITDKLSKKSTIWQLFFFDNMAVILDFFSIVG
jgi:hypothetical protein